MRAESIEERDRIEINLQLDLELEGTFPASDPLTITRFPRKRRISKTSLRRQATDNGRSHPSDV
jgi:hypothetical protein